MFMVKQKLSRKFEENLKKQKKVFTHMNIWMIGKYSVKLHFQKKKDFNSHHGSYY